MQDLTSYSTKSKVALLNKLTLDRLIPELPKVNVTDAEKILHRKAKDFGKNPQALITLIKTAEKFPELKSAIDNTHLVETSSLDIEATEQILRDETSEIFRELRNVIQHRKRLALKKPRNVDDDDPRAIIARANPNHHEKDSIEDLIKYLINNPASGYYFLRQPHRQKELAAKPVLIARMIAGDSNLRQTIQKERTCFLNDIPEPIQRALSAFSETVILLSAPQLKNYAAIYSQCMQELKFITERPSDSDFPEKEAHLLNQRVKDSIINAIEAMLAKLPENGETQLLQKRFQVFKSENYYGWELYDNIKDAVTKFEALAKIHLLLRDPVLQYSAQFNLLRPYLERLNENSSRAEITIHDTTLNEIHTKNNRLRKIYELINEIREKKPEVAEHFHALAKEFDELSEKIKMDKFIGELNSVKNNINFLNQAHLDVESPLFKDSPMLTTLRDQLRELTIHSKKYEVDNFIRALSEARKRALETKKPRSSMEKLPEPPEDISESSLTSSFSELEIYKGSPPAKPKAGH